MSIRNTEAGASTIGAAGLADTLAPEQSPTPAGQPAAAHPGSAFAQTNPAISAATRPPEELSSAGSAAQMTSDSLGAGAVSVVSVVSVRSEFPVSNWERYEFLALLGQGGMGAVYKARDKRLGRIVALKFIRSGDDRMVMRFQQEARAQARIDHAHVCKVYEVGEVDGKTYIAMQFVDGQSLDRGYVSLSLTQKVVVMRQVAEAMHEAHRLGIIHRDLKPANIMLERGEDGRQHPIVMDFGLARESNDGHGLTETGQVMGTPAYMSPEQARGETRIMDRRSDVYSLGATLYDVIIGVPPFDSESIVDLLFKVLNDDPLPMRTRLGSVPTDLETIVMKCLHKEPHQRYDSAKALAEDLDRYLSGEPLKARRLTVTQRMVRQARKHKPLVALGAALLVSLLGLMGFGVRTYIANREKERLAQRQAELAQRLGQDIKDMEWLLRSARQLPLHNLEREKVIVRKHMQQLQTALLSYGELSRGLAHYALGRGHMALHEYPQALVQLRQAIEQGNQSADVHYALGFVLGKHFEQAMYEARLAGGGDWAKKQLKEIEPKYLTPAITSLERSRAMKLDAPQYLEALISFYQRDYDTALKHAEAALHEAPWLYDALKLSGDIHLERALQSRDGGRAEDAGREFAAAVRSFQEAVAIGQSDAEVYEGLAETWVRQVETALLSGQPTETAYAAAVASSDKLLVADPGSIAGPLKKGYAALMTMALLGSGRSSAERVEQCLSAVKEVLKKQPENPYAVDVAAGCYAFSAETAIAEGKDPEPLLRNALKLLEPGVLKNPHFLWGLNDLAVIYQSLGVQAQLHGDNESNEYLQKAKEYEYRALALDETYLNPHLNLIDISAKLLLNHKTEVDLQKELTEVDQRLQKCISLNSQTTQCYVNYLVAYSRASLRTYRAGTELKPRLEQALESLKPLQKIGGNFLDAGQHTALVHWINASERVRRREDPGPALKELEAALGRCFAIAKQDAMCKTLAAQSDWVAADWLALQKKPQGPSLTQALSKALEAIQSPQIYPDAWQVVAESHLRLASAPDTREAARAPQLAEGLAAVEKIFAVNPNHALGRATQGALALRQAQLLREPAARRAAAQAASTALERALKQDPLLAQGYAPLLAQAKEIFAAE